MRNNPVCTLTILLALAIQGCGGGGGGGGGGGVVPPPPNPSNKIISADNAYDTVSIGIVLSEAIAQVSMATFNPVIKLRESGTLTLNVACGSGGTRTVVVTDNDGSQRLSGGDVLTVTWASCDSGEMNATVDGSFSIAITDYWDSEGASTYLAGQLSFSDVSVGSDAASTINGTFDIKVLATVGLEVFEARAQGGNIFSVRIDANGSSVTETVNSIVLSRTTARKPGISDLVYSLTSELSFDSQILDAAISCSTPRELRSTNSNHAPLEGEFLCAASDASRARLNSDRVSRDSAITLQVDTQGNGAWSTLSTPDGDPVYWTSIVEGELFSRQFDVLLGGPFPNPDVVPMLREPLATNDIVYSPVTDRLYASSDTAVLEIDPATLAVARSLALPDTPGAVALSDDGSTLWVALDDTGILQSVDTPSMSTGSTLALGNSVIPDTGLREASRLQVAPGTTDVVVVITRFGEMLAFANGAELPGRIDQTLTTFSPPTVLLFRDASSIVAADGNSTAYSVFQISLDLASGLSLVSERSALGNQSSDRLKFDGENIYASRGAVFDERTEIRVTSLAPQNSAFDDLDVDIDDSLIIGVRNGAGGRFVEVIDLETYQRVSQYNLPPSTPLQRFENLMQTDSYVVARQGDDLVSIAKSDLGQNIYGEPCIYLDLSNLVVPGTHITLQCGITSITHDPGRGLIYASLDGASAEGFAIAVLDETDLSAVAYIPTPFVVGATAISADGSTLYGIVPQSNRYVEIDLDTRVMTAAHSLGLDIFNPYFGNAIASTRGPDGDVILSMGRKLALFDDGNVVGSLANPNAPYDAIHVSSDGASVFGQDFNRLDELSITSSGAVIIQESMADIYPQPAASRNDSIYGVDGRFFDMNSRLVSNGCADAPIIVTPRTRVGAAPDSNELHYAWISDPVINNHRIFLLTCDASTQAFGSTTESPIFSLGATEVDAVLSLPSGRIAVLASGVLVLLDTPAAN